MARSSKDQIPWKPRRLRAGDVAARVAHLQKNLPSVVHEVFAGDESRMEAVPSAAPVVVKKSKHAVLLWEPRGARSAD